MKLFFCSDIHGDYDALEKSLKEANYDEGDPNNKLIVLGDMFDRGDRSLDVYKYLKRLTEEKKAVVLPGNHTQFLIDYLDGTSLSYFNYMYNGTKDTLAEFLHQTAPFETWCLLNKIDTPTTYDFAVWIAIARDEINDEYSELLPWLKSLPYYYESANYIGVHASIDTRAKDWREPNEPWLKLDFDDGSFFGEDIKNTDKKIVIGHFGTEALRKKYNIKDNKAPHDILIRDDERIIAIDATTCITHKVNVFVVEDEEEK